MNEAQARYLVLNGHCVAIQLGEKRFSLAPNIGRNAPCLCGSGKKYKKCCGRGNNGTNKDT